jgi:hypothetical protein
VGEGLEGDVCVDVVDELAPMVIEGDFLVFRVSRYTPAP